MKDQDMLEKELAQVVDDELKAMLDSKEAKPNPTRWERRYESLELSSNDFKNILPSIEQPPVLELKPLPFHLKYVYLEEKEALPLIISS